MSFLYIAHFLQTLLNILLLWFLLSTAGRRTFRLLKKRTKHFVQRQKERHARQWRPKTPHDCPHCQAEQRLQLVHINHEVTPWAQRKGKGGRKKAFCTKGFACLNPHCDYFGITDDTIHALVKDTDRGKDKDILQLKCQCCQKRFSSRKGTPLYYLKAKTGQVEEVLWFLAEGVDISVMVRRTGFHEATLTRWLMRAGTHSTNLHNLLFRGLIIPLAQMDELHARIRNQLKASWLWLVIDPITKAIPSLHLGGRTNADAYALVHDFEQRLDPDCIPAVTTDGLRAYFSALTAHFGRWFRPPNARKDHWQVDERLLHGQLVKRRERRKLTFTITRMRWGKHAHLKQRLLQHGFTANIQTAFIERLNLTLRQGVSLLTRKTWSLAQSQDHLLLHCEWWRAYYHFARPHESLSQPIPGSKRKYEPQTPAMALGLTDHVWTVTQLITMPVPTPQQAA